MKTREEFEHSNRLEIEKAVNKARQIRDRVRLLERAVADKEEKIQNYQNHLADVGNELVNIQIKLYADGTT